MIYFLRTSVFIVLLMSMVFVVSAQTPMLFGLENNLSEVSEDLTASRTMVIVNTKRRSIEWKDMSESLHNSFKVMGIDPVFYAHYYDVNGSPDIREGYLKFAKSRDVRFELMVVEKNEGFQMVIQSLNETDEGTWFAQSESLNDLLLELARSLKRTDQKQQNFLVPSKPEYIEHLPLYIGNRQLNYPDRLKRLKLAVMKMPYADTSAGFELAKAYNKEVDNQNILLDSAFSRYPYKVEVIPYQDEKGLSRKGYQYVLRYIHSSPEAIRSALGYPDEGLTEFMSQVVTPSGDRTLINYSSDKRIYKWYVKQTVVGDVHVGRYWDAHEDFESSLRSFVSHMQQNFQ
jgi:hypothetical protein